MQSISTPRIQITSMLTLRALGQTGLAFHRNAMTPRMRWHVRANIRSAKKTRHGDRYKMHNNWEDCQPILPKPKKRKPLPMATSTSTLSTKLDFICWTHQANRSHLDRHSRAKSVLLVQSPKARASSRVPCVCTEYCAGLRMAKRLPALAALIEPHTLACRLWLGRKVLTTA